MCNLYTYRMTAEDMRLLKAHHNLVGREYLDVLQTRNDDTKMYPNYEGPVILKRETAGVLERGAILASPKRFIEPMLWGMPASSIANTNRGVTNVRNAASAHWKRWLKNPASRCVVPVSRFAEPDGRTSKPVVNRWFRRPDDSLFFFPGIWTEWEGDRGTKAKPHVARHKLFGFLTTDPNALVKPVHQKAMPVVLTMPAEVDQWLRAPIEEALGLQKPAADDVLEIAPEEKTRLDQVFAVQLYRRGCVVRRPCFRGPSQPRPSHPIKRSGLWRFDRRGRRA